MLFGVGLSGGDGVGEGEGVSVGFVGVEDGMDVTEGLAVRLGDSGFCVEAAM